MGRRFLTVWRVPKILFGLQYLRLRPQSFLVYFLAQCPRRPLIWTKLDSFVEQKLQYLWIYRSRLRNLLMMGDPGRHILYFPSCNLKNVSIIISESTSPCKTARTFTYWSGFVALGELGMLSTQSSVTYLNSPTPAHEAA